MRSARHVRVMMLGWEYPPRFAGGLGKASQGLAQGMARSGAQIFFVLPTFPERVSEKRLEVVGARECLQETGWDFESPGYVENISILRTDARLHPYDSPGKPVPERILRFFEQTVSVFRPKPASARQESAEKKSFEKKESPEIYGKNLWNEVERFAARVRYLADAHEVDVVHAHDWMTFPAAFEFHRMTGVPVFLHVHATEYDRSGDNLNNDVFRIEREGFRRATHIFAVSRYTAGILESLYGVNRKKITVVYNAPEEKLRRFIGSPEAKRQPQVVFLGRLTFQKGPDHFLRAAALVSQLNSDARFIFCGSGDMLEQLRVQAHRLGVEDRVHFAGFVEPSAVDDILVHSKVLVMPSVSEPFGLVALEAIRCGIPIIISKQSGVREVLHRALQVDFWDHEKLADQILAALRLPSLSKQLVEEGMDQLQQLSWEKSAQRVIEVYRQHLGTTYYQAIEGAHGH